MSLFPTRLARWLPYVPKPASVIRVFSQIRHLNNRRKEPPDTRKLSLEQQELVNLILTGRNVFYTGAAGTGKSEVLKAAVKSLRDLGCRVHVVAPTGRAALAIEGMTTWSYAGWSPSSHTYHLRNLRSWSIEQQNLHRLAYTDVLFIDEISMVENHHLERLSEIMKAAKAHEALKQIQDQPEEIQLQMLSRSERLRNTAFGGCQIIATGDFFQLPPVCPFQRCVECGNKLLKELQPGATTYRCSYGHGTWYDSEKWAFRSKVWAHANFAHVELKQVHRQEGDPRFIDILNRVRFGTLTSNDVMILADPGRKTKDLRNAVRLYPIRSQVDRYNDDRLRKLKGPPYDFFTLDSFYWNKKAHPHLKFKGNRQDDGTLTALREHKYEPVLRLKVGMPVILLSNISIGEGLVNGSQGIVVGFTSQYRINEWRTASAKERHILEIMYNETFRYFMWPKNPSKTLPIVRFNNGITKVIHLHCSTHAMGNEVVPIDRNNTNKIIDYPPPSVLCRTQIPLTAGWAMSIHKAQGMSLDGVIVDLTRAFEEGQVYVALSRARRLDGLKVEGDPNGLLTRKEGNPEVKKFYQENFGH